MTEVVYHKAPKRLARLLARPGGLRVAEALRRAEQGLFFMEEACLGSIDGAIARVAAALERLKRDAEDRGALDELYTCGDEIFSLAGPAQLDLLGRAGFSLCELVDRFLMGRPVMPAAVQVHLDALNRFRRPVEDRAGELPALAVLEGLNRLVKSV